MDVEETVGAVITRARLARGLSQLRLADLLCAASGQPTVTRHEVSRWEREERVPGAFWSAWLAAVLELPVEVLSGAASGQPRIRAVGGRLADPLRFSGVAGDQQCAGSGGAT